MPDNIQLSEIRDASLAESGRRKIEWVERNMPVVGRLEAEFARTKPFAGVRFAVSVHMEAKTARLAKAIKAGGGIVSAAGCNPLSTQDDVAAALSLEGVSVHAWHDESPEEYKSHLLSALGDKPNVVIDDGGDLAMLLHTEKQDLLPHVRGGCEETTTGINRLLIMQREGALKYPVIAVNNAYCKHLFDNRYGTGQSVWDGINRTTNLIVAGKTVVVAGYGWCGKGVAMRAKGFGAKVAVCEIDPIKATEAWMDGFDVMPMDEAGRIGDLFITVTGCNNVICERHFKLMKDGTIMCNAGHFNVEIDIPALEALAVEQRERRANIMGYRLPSGRWVNLLAQGRLVNLASGDGHPAEIMDMSFAIQLLGAKYIVEHGASLKNELIFLPAELDRLVAQYKLESMGVRIDALTADQERYLDSWNLG
ncbi:MAG: adenosylhomocysteinase [Clostridiales bacterium]|jgi:adenosylhomocysteinase|nr:adenosylhomocysteinase [Clostridiales bacterium]